jgi:transcriptional regulator with PAS, ATPase and Fis domain
LLSRVAECIEAGHERSPYEDSMTESSPLETSGGYLEVSAGASMEEIERVAIETALRRHGGNRTHAAEALGISVRTLQRKLKAWAIASP